MSRTIAEQIGGRCKHFTGVQNDECAVGLRYAEVRRTQGSKGPYRLPCLVLDPKPLPPCARRCFPTAEEVKLEEAEWEAAIEEHMAKLAKGECPTCGKNLEPRRQVGRCSYGACGHRIGQTGG